MPGIEVTSEAAAGRTLIGERPRLVVASFAMLFAELALIRWVSAYQIYVAYFANFVLLASFLGIGVGFLRARASRNGFRWAPLALATFIGFVFFVRVTVGLNSQELQTVFGWRAPANWLVLPLLFLGSALVMALIAEGVARLFARFEPLEAYRLDIAGSLLGIVAFSALSFLGAGPFVWGLVLAAAFLLLSPRADYVGRWFAVGAVFVALAFGSFAPHDVWSPYYRVSVHPEQDGGRIPIRVNSLPHQSMLSLDDIRGNFYSEPYSHLNGPVGNVLVVGAGNGNDVALALDEGAAHVDAVEIDPRLQQAGSEHHPARPYQDERVTSHIDDGRAFLERTRARYDLILFALPDSLTLVSGQGSLRLESYLFTREAMESVRDRLAPGGAFAMYNYYRPFVFERYANTMREVFGHEPCFDAGLAGNGPRSQSVLTIGRESGDIVCRTPWEPIETAPTPATDDHPFPYVVGRIIPSFYLWWLGAILLASLVIVRVASGAPLGQMRPYADLFCMGAAFLLLETKSVVQFALLFGTTWFVNSLVFAGILLAVLAAIELARRWRLPPASVMYGLLFSCLVVAWVVPPAALLALAPVPRFFASVALAFAPVFVANLIFAQRFRSVGASTVAFGANLLGAMLGGVLEYLAIVTGYRALLLLVALLYGAAAMMGRDQLKGRGASVEPVTMPASDDSRLPIE